MNSHLKSDNNCNISFRFGFAAEFCPRCIIPSKITCEKTKKVKFIHEYSDSKELYDNLVEFIQQICIRYMSLCITVI